MLKTINPLLTGNLLSILSDMGHGDFVITDANFPAADRLAVERIGGQWRAPCGDRWQELVLIGSGMNRKRITAALVSCLLRDQARLSPRAIRQLRGSFASNIRANGRNLASGR